MSGVWNTVAIAGKLADIYDPAQPVRPQLGILFLHDQDLETVRDRPVFSGLFDELKLVCVCPQGGRCWWGDRICTEYDARIAPERYLLDHVMPFFQERWGLGPRAIGIAGIGMGGQGALRLAFKHPQVFPVVGAIAAAVDYYELYGTGTCLDDMYDSKEQCRQDTAPMHIHPNHYPSHIFFAIDPEDDAWLRGNDRLHEKLGALGVPHECDLTSGAGGHSWEYFDRMADRVLRFVGRGLEQESRRLL
jgi:esterase/lipase superfamily enzyme